MRPEHLPNRYDLGLYVSVERPVPSQYIPLHTTTTSLGMSFEYVRLGAERWNADQNLPVLYVSQCYGYQ